MEKIIQGVNDAVLALFATKSFLNGLEDIPYFGFLAVIGIPGAIIGLYKFFKWWKNNRRF